MYDGIPYAVKQGADDRGITAEIYMSQHTDFNESASVACSNAGPTAVKAGHSERMTPLR